MLLCNHSMPALWISPGAKIISVQTAESHINEVGLCLSVCPYGKRKHSLVQTVGTSIRFKPLGRGRPINFTNTSFAACKWRSPTGDRLFRTCDCAMTTAHYRFIWNLVSGVDLLLAADRTAMAWLSECTECIRRTRRFWNHNPRQKLFLALVFKWNTLHISLHFIIFYRL
jgi:hypothetical protein